MAEIRLGSISNMKNINLGSVEIQEVYLGTILVWQNNLGPTLMSITWDGTTLTGIPALVDMQQDDFTTSNANIGVNAEVTSGVRTISIVVGGLADPDNVDPATDDFIVGYRLQRPDGTWIAGDPEDTGANTFTAPIADFGAALPGVTATYDTIEEEFTAGLETVASSNIQALLRNTDASDNEVVSEGQTFRDSGEWILTVIDSRGGEKVITIPNIDLVYPAPSFTVAGVSGSTYTLSNVTSGTPPTTDIQNATIGGPSSFTLTPTQAATGGPVVSRIWSCVSGCTGGPFTTDTISVTIPQDPGGSATPSIWQLTETGRRWSGDSGVALTGTRRVGFRSGPSCTPSISVSSSSFSFVADTSPAICSGAMSPATFSVGCSGTCDGFSYTSGTNFSQPNPGCTGVNTLQTATVSVNGSTTGAISGINAGGSRGYSGSYPQVNGNACAVTVNCSGAPFSVRNSACGTVVNTTVACSGTTCAGAPANTGSCNGAVLTGLETTEPNNYRGGDVVGSSFCNGGTSTATVNYSAIQATWSVVCPGGGEGMTEAELEAGCVPTQTNSVDITSSSFTVNASGSCLPGDFPPQICFTGTCTATNGTGCKIGSIACFRPATCG